MKCGVKWAVNSCGLILSVIRIALKWLIGLLCGHVITTTGGTEAHHIRHQSESSVDNHTQVVLREGIPQS